MLIWYCSIFLSFYQKTQSKCLVINHLQIKYTWKNIAFKNEFLHKINENIYFLWDIMQVQSSFQTIQNNLVFIQIQPNHLEGATIQGLSKHEREFLVD